MNSSDELESAKQKYVQTLKIMRDELQVNKKASWERLENEWIKRKERINEDWLQRYC
jgi:uncharacterized protein (DUF1919 family)